MRGLYRRRPAFTRRSRHSALALCEAVTPSWEGASAMIALTATDATYGTGGATHFAITVTAAWGSAVYEVYVTHNHAWKSADDQLNS